MTDFSLAGFAEHLAEIAVEAEHRAREGLEEAARLVEAEAKDEIGTYQDQAGPFPAWAELADSTKADRVRAGFSENDPLLRTGEMRDSIEHTVIGKTAYVGTDNQIAVYQELGTQRIPPRSFLGGAAFRKGHEVAEIIGSRFVSALTGQQVPGGALAIPRSPEQGVTDQQE
jgi:phage gpG-like protein